MITERKEHIREAVLGPGGKLVLSYTRENGKADTVSIMVVDMEHDTDKEYACIITTNRAVLTECIELLRMIRDEVWPV